MVVERFACGDVAAEMLTRLCWRSRSAISGGFAVVHGLVDTVVVRQVDDQKARIQAGKVTVFSVI
jgi:hypothetical protein